MATPTGRSRVILRVPDPPSGQTNFRALAASGRRIAVLVGGYDQPTLPRLLVSSGGAFRDVALAPGCETQTADIDGPRIAYIARCDGSYRVGVTGPRETLPIAGMPLGGLGGAFESEVRIAGRYVAWAEASFPIQPHIVVYDLRRDRVAFRVDLSPYLQGGYEGVGSKWLGFDLDKSGRVAYMAGTEPEQRTRIVGWSSPAHPAVHRKVVDVFDRKRIHGGGVLAFDGKRLAWTGMNRLTRPPFSRWDVVTNQLQR